MKHWAMRLMWVFLAAPWLTWVVFHPLADVRLGWTLVAHPRESGGAVMETLRDAYDVPPFSYMFNGVRVVEEARKVQLAEFSYDQADEGVRTKKPALARGRNRMVRRWQDGGCQKKSTDVAP
jgi:hypothetical protein